MMLSAVVALLWADASCWCQVKAADAAAVAAGADLSPAPTTDEQVKSRVEQLHRYQPYLRACPRPSTLGRVDLPGTWRSKFELAHARQQRQAVAAGLVAPDPG